MKVRNLTTVSEEKNPQQLFEEIENMDLSGVSSSEIKRRFEIACNAMEYNLNQMEYLIDFCLPATKMTA